MNILVVDETACSEAYLVTMADQVSEIHDKVVED